MTRERNTDRVPRRRRILIPALVSVLLLGAGGVGGWALAVLLAPPAPLPKAAPYALAQSHEGTLERTIRLKARVTWPKGVAVNSPRSGTLTGREVGNGDQVNVGDTIMTINMSPTIVAQGSVPAYRDMQEGDTGPDVAQLKRFLNHVTGAGLYENDRFDAYTASAVAYWHKTLGQEDTPVVTLGELAFVDTLPARISWEDIAVGAHVEEGSPAFSLMTAQPGFTITLPEGQLALVEEGMNVALSFQDKKWNALIGGVVTNEENESVTTLLPVDGAQSICADQCSMLPVEGTENIDASITVVPATQGIIVPTAAIVVSADGSTAVVTKEGAIKPVTVKANVGGESVVEGIEADVTLRVGTSTNIQTPNGPEDSGGNTSPVLVPEEGQENPGKPETSGGGETSREQDASRG
ncbi:efflux RND transporter periplasmic adaptor subunit [Schaalia sp. ZJ405]|uniref:efflux RND transporter periplasmic adaptor subunit n=1 Tax=Schaalia sp. ZJ405 TaxID=2709403 RepID=UPI0013E9DA41|nr:efflux RND transporter periplasmic adaptor subunit [Schaalia sp. ZJ405]QPK80951.1 efflux RND transporter periplasmic adaptor subunit [Schaalia sp. ZJ405]